MGVKRLYEVPIRTGQRDQHDNSSWFEQRAWADKVDLQPANPHPRRDRAEEGEPVPEPHLVFHGASGDPAFAISQSDLRALLQELGWWAEPGGRG